jgi:bilirubin oxidase
MKYLITSCYTFFVLSIAISQNPLYIPETLSGTQIDLLLQNSETEIFGGFFTNSIGYNQSILGPTLILEKGQQLSVDVTNNLSEPTTLHWHGLHVSPKNDGGPHTIIEPGQTWSPSFTILDKAATYWYHPHLHESTESQVTLGAAGFIIVKDQEEAALELPRDYGIDDFPLLIQSRAFDENNQFVAKTAADNNILCNATLEPYLDAPAQVVRLRVLNGSTERIFNLGLSDNQPFYQIATDGGLLPSPVSNTRLIIAPGERAEILIDFSNMLNSNIKLISYNSELNNGYYGALNPSVMPVGSIVGYEANELNGSNFDILNINVVDKTDDAITSIPNTLIEQETYSIDEVDITRSLTFRSSQMGPSGMLNGPFTIDGESYNKEIINQSVTLGSTEIWELTNMTAIAHPFHIHDVQFHILDVNGIVPSEHLQGNKDVVLVPPMGGTVRFITRFDDFADVETPYMYHCHMLSHEDSGMMGQFLVLPIVSINKETKNSNIRIYPNPPSESFRVIGISNCDIIIYNKYGQQIKVMKQIFENEPIDISFLMPGHYIVNIKKEGTELNYKLIKT